MIKIISVVLVGVLSFIFLPSNTEKQEVVNTKIYKYQESNNAHVFDGVAPYWVEVTPGNECDPIDPTLPCTVTIEIGSGSGQYANLDAFLDQFGSVSALMAEQNVTGKDE